MTRNEARALGCAFFDNRYGVRRLCSTSNPRLWPFSRIYNVNPTCAGCIDMLAERVEEALRGECEHPELDSVATDPHVVAFCRSCGKIMEA